MDGSQLPLSTAPRIILITGTMAAGKSSVAQALAERLPKSVHLRGDGFRRMIVRGQAAMSAELSEEAYGQLRLRYRLAAMAAVEYLQAGFTVVYQDIIIGPELAEVVGSFAGQPLSVIVLCPRTDVVAAREAGRNKTGYREAAEVEAFDQIVRTQTPHIGYWLDSSDLTVAATVDHILAHMAEAGIE